MRHAVILLCGALFTMLFIEAGTGENREGLISVPVSNVVSEPETGSSLETQCVMGERVAVVEVRGDWTRIVALEQPSRKDERGYPGWVYSRNISFTEQFKPVVLVDDAERVYDEEKRIECTLLLGSRTDLIGYEGDTAHIRLPNGTTGYVRAESVSTDSLERSAESVISHIQHFIGVGYLWGGTTPYGFDCSGLLYRVGKVHGYDLARDSSDQAFQGTEVKSPQRGDFVFIGQNGRVTHVALYIGNGEIIHAVGFSGGSMVAISELSDYADSVISYRRIL
jgi:hypothetical protein